MSDWVHPNTIVGSVAEGGNYFHRTEIEEKFWVEIEKGNHILFTAPRRVGKSSVMKYLAQKEKDGYLCIYQNIESDASSIEFYTRLFELIISRLDRVEKAKTRFSKLYNKLSIEEVSTTGVKLGKNDYDYKRGVFEIVEELKEQEIKVVLFLDEFPDVIDSIAINEGNETARDVLHTTRRLRHSEEFKGCFTMILAGSIGLSHIVAKIDKQSIVNDLYSVEIESLSKDQAKEFIEQFTKEATMVFNEKEEEYLIQKIGYLLPYYLQLMIEEVNFILRKDGRPEVAVEDIDKAYDSIVDKNSNFLDWPSRLKKYFPELYAFLVKVLTQIAHSDGITIQEAYNLGIEFDLEFDFKLKIDEILVKDGYLVEKDTKYYFLSPFLKDWWKRRYPRVILN